MLQLINDYTAVALNYGIFRRKEFNETAQYFVFYDMGASKTSASVISYQLVKDKATKEILPVVQVLGVAFDRTLGGLEMQVRLRDYLGHEFNKMGKTKTDVFTNPRAMAKLFKEAGRLKNVLSANPEHYAQIEGLLEEHDFRLPVSRDQFEALCKDLFERVTAPIERALAASGLSLDVISQVVLFGGSTRVPKVQEVLKTHIKEELGRNLNADEAACMGAVYRAADLATGFKVKKFIVKDAVLFPIQVVFAREGESGNSRLVRRTLFGPMNSYPQKKVITFNKHTDDFEFSVDYAELETVLGKGEFLNMGSLNLTKVSLTEVAKKLNANKADNIESKGIKAHFALDDSGLFSLANVELVLEKTVTDDEESTLQKLGNTISKLFSGDSDDEKVTTEETTKDEPKEADQAEEKKQEDDKSSNTTNAENATLAEENDAAKNKTEKPKIVTIKEQIPSKVELIYVKPLDGAEFESSVNKIRVQNEADEVKKRRETALNALETFVIDAQVRLDEEEYASCATQEEIDSIRKSCGEISEWLYEDGADADAETYEKKLEELSTVANQVYARHWEHKERPEALSALNQMITGADGFLDKAKNFTKEGNPVKDVYTQVEIDTLTRIIKETIEWRDTEVREQKKIARNAAVRLTVKDITDKMALLDREVKYLVNKLKLWRPKVKPTPPPKLEKDASKEDKQKSEETAEEDAEKDEPVVEEAPKQSAEEEASSEEQTEEQEINPSKTEEDSDEHHTEL